MAAPWVDLEQAGVGTLKATSGHEVYAITSAQRAEWRKAAEPLVSAWADSVRKAGGNADAIMKDLKGTLAEFGANY